MDAVIALLIPTIGLGLLAFLYALPWIIADIRRNRNAQ
jgi:hypothetical protein